MREGHITLPRPERDYLIEARSGTWTLPHFIAEAARLRQEAEQSPSPESVDTEAISALIAEVTLESWATNPNPIQTRS